MRATDDRYRGEQAKFELAMRMIKHEARTGTIRYLTGINDDRIRKLYSTYFKHGEVPVKRRRGRSPTRVAPLVRTPTRALESGLFANLLLANGLFSIENPPGPNLKGNIDLGHRFCECFESRGEELGIARCETCSVCYVFDLLALPRSACPACRLFEHRTELALSAASAPG